MTYLQLVNAVLVKLRAGATVGGVNSGAGSTAFGALVGVWVNEVKREVENAWEWNALRSTFAIATADGTFSYVLTGSDSNTRIRNIYNKTSRWKIQERNQEWMTDQFILAAPPQGSPFLYSRNGQVDATQEQIIDLLPIPKGGPYALNVNVVRPQADLAADTDVLQVPNHLVVLGAFYKAVVDRGDDKQVVERAELAYKNALATAISHDETDELGEFDWQPR